MWNSELFSKIVGEAAKRQLSICGIRCGSKRAVHQSLGAHLGLGEVKKKKWIG